MEFAAAGDTLLRLPLAPRPDLPLHSLVARRASSSLDPLGHSRTIRSMLAASVSILAATIHPSEPEVSAAGTICVAFVSLPQTHLGTCGGCDPQEHEWKCNLSYDGQSVPEGSCRLSSPSSPWAVEALANPRLK